MDQSNDNLTVPPPADAKEQIGAALKSGKARGKFRSVEEVVADGVRAGEKEPAAGSPAPADDKTEPLSPILPDKIEIEVDETTGKRTVKGEPEAPPATAPVVEPPAAEPVKTAAAKKIKIGEKEFTNEDEAITYAQELENQRIVDEAFRQGIEAASQLPGSNLNPVAAAKPPEEEKIPDLYYTNPAAYLKAREQEILAKATQNISAQFEAQKNHERTMTKFWSEYPDLARNQATQDLTNAILQQNFNALKNVQTEKALKIIAEKARAKLTELGVTTLPVKEIPSTAKSVVSSGSSVTTARPKQEEKQLNMAQFLRQTKTKKMAARLGR